MDRVKGKREKEITSPASVQLMRCPRSWGHSWACWGYFWIGRFPHQEGLFLVFCANYPLCAVHFFRPFWKWAGELQGSGIVLIPLYSPCPHLGLIPALALCCASLSELDWGCLSRVSAALPLHGPFSSQACYFSCQYQQLSVITNNPWLAPQPSSYHCLRHTH